MPSPLVSVLIPAYRAESWIEETLTSVFSQTHRPLEIVLVDDGSADRTVELATKMSVPADVSLQIVTQQNQGAAATRNRAFGLSRGDYIQYLDADDLLAADKIERQLLALQTSPPRSIACGPWGRFSDDPQQAVITPEDNWRTMNPIAWLHLNFAGRGMMPPVAWLTPRTLVEAAGPWDESLTLNDDGEFFCRVLLASAGVVFCPEARSYYRSNLSQSLSKSTSAAAWDSALRSQTACVEHLLRIDDSAASRAAGADLLIRLAHACYPTCREIAERAESLSQQWGKSRIRPAGGKLFRIIDRGLGWKFARRLQSWRGAAIRR